MYLSDASFDLVIISTLVMLFVLAISFLTLLANGGFRLVNRQFRFAFNLGKRTRFWLCYVFATATAIAVFEVFRDWQRSECGIGYALTGPSWKCFWPDYYVHAIYLVPLILIQWATTFWYSYSFREDSES